LEDNDIYGADNHVCDYIADPDRLVMSADSPDEIICQCCKYNCSNTHICYFDEDLLPNIDLNYDQKFSVTSTYVRDNYVFSEDIVFSANRVANSGSN
jgi:hypothetical protein